VAQIDSPQIRADKVGAAEIRGTKHGVAEVGVAQVAAVEVGTLEDRGFEVGAREVGVLQLGPREIRLAQVCVLQIGVSEVRQRLLPHPPSVPSVHPYGPASKEFERLFPIHGFLLKFENPTQKVQKSFLKILLVTFAKILLVTFAKLFAACYRIGTAKNALSRAFPTREKSNGGTRRNLSRRSLSLPVRILWRGSDRAASPRANLLERVRGAFASKASGGRETPAGGARRESHRVSFLHQPSKTRVEPRHPGQGRTFGARADRGVRPR
jgi:hypothetical protein